MKASSKINTRTILFAGIVVSVMFIIASMVIENIKNGYEQKIIDIRKQKDHFFRTAQSSPIPEKEKFEGLSYFNPDQKYKVKASLELLKDSLPINIMRTDGSKDQYIRFARATFTLNKKPYSLVLLKTKNEGPNDHILFLPFSDNTNGDGTYDGGRYLDVEYKKKSYVILDFNQAYNPYCVYSYKYSCPVPPEENNLPVDILAGEKSFEGSAD